MALPPRKNGVDHSKTAFADLGEIATSLKEIVAEQRAIRKEMRLARVETQRLSSRFDALSAEVQTVRTDVGAASQRIHECANEVTRNADAVYAMASELKELRDKGNFQSSNIADAQARLDDIEHPERRVPPSTVLTNSRRHSDG